MKGDGWWWFWIVVVVLFGVVVTALKASALVLYPYMGFETTTGSVLPVSFRVVANESESVVFWIGANNSASFDGYVGWYEDDFTLRNYSFGWFDAYEVDCRFYAPGTYEVVYGFNDSGGVINQSTFEVNVTGDSLPLQGANWSLRGLTPLEAFCKQYPARCAPDAPTPVHAAPALPPPRRVMAAAPPPAPVVMSVVVVASPVVNETQPPQKSSNGLSWWAWVAGAVGGAGVVLGYWWLGRVGA